MLLSMTDMCYALLQAMVHCQTNVRLHLNALKLTMQLPAC
jgi:hypothetical protein